MEFELIFCTDGILRIKFGNKPMIPAKFIHDSYPYKSDLSFWTRWWEGYTYFEEGLTVSQFLSCLDPWADFWQELTHKNIKAFIDESKKPLLVKETSDEKPLTWISLSYQLEMDLETQYESKVSTIDLNQWLNAPKNAKLTGEWNIYGSYKLTGYSSGYQEQYSVDHSPMNELANLPLVLNKKQILTVDNSSAKRILGKDYQFFPDNSFGVRVITHENSDYKTVYLQGNKEHRLREMIEGFFWWFPSNPVSRDAFNESLRMSIEEIDSLKVNEDEGKESNVVPLFKDKESSNLSHNEENSEATENSEKNENKKLTVKVAPGAFSSITQQIDKNVQLWDELLEKAKESDDVVIKIGKLKEAKPLENRIYAYIASDEDISTPFKEV